MKKLLLFMVIAATALCSNAYALNDNQSDEIPAGYEYVPIVREGVEWGYAWMYGGEYARNGHYIMKFNGDIVINGKKYKKLYRTPYYSFNAFAELAGYMREENKKVYGMSFGHINGDIVENPQEELLYDFNAKVGEPVAFNDRAGIVEKIEYVKFRDGGYRKKYHLSGLCTIIEGLGNVNRQHGDILNVSTALAGCQRCLFTSLVYVSYADSQWYNQPEEFEYRDDLDNFYEYGYVESVSEDAPTLMIRHGGDRLMVESGCDCYDNAELVDAFGRTVKSVAVAEGETSVIIPTAGLATGVYVVSLSGASAKTSQKVFIK